MGKQVGEDGKAIASTVAENSTTGHGQWFSLSSRYALMPLCTGIPTNKYLVHQHICLASNHTNWDTFVILGLFLPAHHHRQENRLGGK
jgi:hypothetical protein